MSFMLQEARESAERVAAQDFSSALALAEALFLIRPMILPALQRRWPWLCHDGRP